MNNDKLISFKMVFKAKWKILIKDERIKPKISNMDVVIRNKKETIKIKNAGILKAEHFILYNKIFEREIDRGFVKDSKGFLSALERIEKINKNEYLKNTFLVIFRDYFSTEEIDKITEILAK